MERQEQKKTEKKEIKIEKVKTEIKMDKRKNEVILNQNEVLYP